MKINTAQDAAVSRVLRTKMAEAAETNENATTRRRLRRALRNQRVFRRVKAELLEELAEENGYHNPEALLAANTAAQLEAKLEDGSFDWDAFMDFLLQVLQILIKLFL